MSVAPPRTVILSDHFARELTEMAVPWQAEEVLDPRLLQVTDERSLGAEGPGPLSTLIKLAWSRLGQQLTEFRLDALGPAGMIDGDSAHRFVSSRMLSIAGGTTEVLRNLIAERVLGLPKEP